MKRFIALLLTGVLLAGGACAAAEADPGILSWDFTFRFHLNTDVFAFREREHMQGYADLLEALELKGNYSWCEDTNSLDLYAELLPAANPSSGISFRMSGSPELVQISSPLLGKEAVWLEPARFMYFAERTWEALQIPLPYLALLLPVSTTDAFRWIPEIWNEEAGPFDESKTVPYALVEWIAGLWREELENNNYLETWVDALTNFLPESGPVRDALGELPDLLLAVSGGEDLEVEVDVTAEGKTLRCLNSDGIVFFEEHRSGEAYGCALTLPEIPAEYIPSLFLRQTETGGTVSLKVKEYWDRSDSGEDGEEQKHIGYSEPDSILQAELEAENLPLELPMDTDFAGRISVAGYLLPNFSFLFSGSASAAGEVILSLTAEEKPEAGPVLTCSGTVVRANREEPLAYDPEELKTDFNFFGLNDESLHRLVSSMIEPFIDGIIDFLYELPASSCQSIMDDLEDYGVLQTLLK